MEQNTKQKKKKKVKKNIKWRPVSNISVDEIYKDLPEVKQFHESYVRFWLTNKKGRL